ncbi:MAG: radical SAM protein [Candidatus Riflebacteria bacterium]|nr:radical SAM protein [Candidatus Riflebacteria bacterium]
MGTDQPKIQANANFHLVSGKETFQKRDPRFIEYRKCWKEWPETFHVGEFPLFLDLEVTSVCNLKCPFCATTYRGHLIPKGFISFEIIRKIIDEGAEKGLYGVKFNIRGEPLLHPEITEFVRYAKSKGLIDVYFNTNALLLDETIAEKLIEAGLDRLSISFEGYTKEVYEKHRVGSSYEKVLANIDTMQALKRRLGVSHPKIRVQTVMTPELSNSLEDYRKFWENRADEVAYLDFKEMKRKKKKIIFPWACPQIWQRMAVFWDGTILPCNHDDEAFLKLGNINDTNISQCWNSTFLSKLRICHKNGEAHKFEACDGCYLRDSEIAKLIESQTPPK